MSAPAVAAPRWAEALAALPRVGLDELQDVAALQTRVDRKYVLALDALPDLAAALPAGTRRLVLDDRDAFGYESVYFDTPDLEAFRLAAGRRRRRYKVRTRTYCDTGGCWLEVKTRGPRSTTVKERREHDLAARADVGDSLEFVLGTLRARGLPVDDLDLAPTLTTRYRRRTLLLPDGARTTVDTDLQWLATGPAGGADPADGADGDTRSAGVPGHAVVETKSVGGASAADRVLWSLGHRPARISKYATGLVVLDPSLADRPWRRTVRHALRA
ncbi:VTC domain-containing protein [Cellulomonas sp. C5510]|uniref:VTC domain-containing protein n=1 Tax=Cellulomonas sp. C5510 TaxID=2871170 RepID=UPI001C94C91F|nr:VTC domain-containing protein [Cellulomonas sp. C5510]QZN87234.1 VTC domain-containing protein [Cellulomonas sp. C5510]